MTGPLRIQRQRTKGWRLPENTVCVTRPGRFANPFRLINEEGFPLIEGPGLTEGCNDWDVAERRVVELFRERTLDRLPNLNPLRGKNLACWCRLCVLHAKLGGKPLNEACPHCAPCHVDVLGEIANARGAAA